MTTIAEAIEALRHAVSEAASGERAAIGDAIDRAAFKDAAIVAVPGDDTIGHVSVTPSELTTVEQLEGILGPARRLPRNPSGGLRTVLFGDTLPGDGEAGATVLAEVDEEGRVRRLIVRADAF
jgi:hypothetical protein